MGAVKQRAYEHENRYAKPKREVPPADYSDEVTDEQLDAARKHIGDTFDGWDIVDGPAW